MEITSPRLFASVAFRFSADFDVYLRQSQMPGLSTQQIILLESIVTSPPTLHRIARMALETDLADVSGRQLGDLFQGPSNDDILECVLACLSEADKIYWEKLKGSPGDALHYELTPVFLAFEVRLRRTDLAELPPLK